MRSYIVVLVSSLTLIHSPAMAISCDEIAQFMGGIATVRSLKPDLTAARSKQLLREDPNFSAKERRVLEKYIDLSYSKSEPVDALRIPIDPRDCK